MRRLAVLVVCCVWAAGAALTAQDPDADRISVELLLGRAGWYVQDFIDKFSNVVSEETYIQDSGVPMQSAHLLGRRGVTAARTRVLKSDFLLVAIRSTQEIIAFRDVFEVDAQPVRDREQRLAKLFLNPSDNSLEQAYRIQNESTRYNLGTTRTINNPLLGIIVVQPDLSNRFRYTLGKMDPKVGPGVWIVDFHEEARPSIIRGRADLDLFANGRVWIELETGRVLKTEILLEQPSLSARVTTSFRFDERFGIAVPFEMQEEYKYESGGRVTAVATYDRFRHFDVSTNELLKD